MHRFLLHPPIPPHEHYQDPTPLALYTNEPPLSMQTDASTNQRVSSAADRLARSSAPVAEIYNLLRVALLEGRRRRPSELINTVWGTFSDSVSSPCLTSQLRGAG